MYKYFKNANGIDNSEDIKEEIKIEENIFVKRKNKIKDIKELTNAIVLLRKENISGKEELNLKTKELINKKENVRDTIKSLENKNVSFNQAAKYIITYNKNKESFEKYGNKKTKYGTYKKCEGEILSFLHAKEKIEELGINPNVSSDKLIEKIKEQKEEVATLSKELKLVEARINNIANANNKIDDILKDEKEIKRAIER